MKSGLPLHVCLLSVDEPVLLARAPVRSCQPVFPEDFEIVLEKMPHEEMRMQFR